MGSTRLPGKVLKKVLGKTVLEYLIERLRRANTLDKIIIATTDNPQDDAIIDLARKLRVDVFRGSEDDVLDRFYQAAKHYHAQEVVRVTADCPLMDPAIIDQVVSFFKLHQDRFNYVSNVHPPTFPDGMDVEIFSFTALERSWREATLTSEREHVTAYIGNHPEIFRLGNVSNEKNLSQIRLTLDNAEDLLVIEKIMTVLYENKDFGLSEIMDWLNSHPEIVNPNRHIERNEGYKKSLLADKTSFEY